MIAQLLFAAKSQFFDNNGSVLTLGSIEITYSLTSEEAPTYTNSAKTALNDFPIQLTAAGKADIYLDSGSYNIVSRNREGVVVDTTNEYIVSDHSLINVGGVTPVGGIIMYAGLISEIPEGWHLCDGSEGTPPLQDRFIKGTVYQDNIGDSGGSADTIIVTHTHAMLHTHDLDHVHSIGAHNHLMTHTHTITHNHTMGHTHSQPTHTHTMGTHTHTIAKHTHTMGEHTHSIAHDHEGISAATNSIPDHVHNGVMELTYTGTGCAGTDSGYLVLQDTWDKNTKEAGGHIHSVTVDLPKFTGDSGEAGSATTGSNSTPNTGANTAANTGADGDDTTGASSEGSTGGSSAANTGASSDSYTGTEPIFNTSTPSNETTTDASNPQTGSAGVSGVGKNDPEFYTLAYIMRLA